MKAKLILILFFITALIYGQSNDTIPKLAPYNGTTSYYFQIGKTYNGIRIFRNPADTLKRIGVIFNLKTTLDTVYLDGVDTTNQTFAVDSSGTNFNISSTGTTHRFNIPSASATARGLMTIGAQTIAGNKTYSGHNTYNGTSSFVGKVWLPTDSSYSMVQVGNIFYNTYRDKIGYSADGGIETYLTSEDWTKAIIADSIARSKNFNWVGIHNYRQNTSARLDVPATAKNNIGAIAWTGELVVGTGSGTNTMVRVEGTYSNPAWLTALAWSKISSKPTTLAGYGITDGVSLGGNNAFTGANTISSSLSITSTGALYLSSYAPVGLKGAIYHDNGATAKLLYSTNGVGGENTVASEAWVSAQGYSTLPSQTGNNGKFLTTDGSTTSWASVGGVDPSANYNWTGIHDFTKAVTTSTNLVSSLVSSGTSGVTNKAIVGTATSTATPTAQNLYGGYFSATGYNSGGSNGYGIYATATGSSNNYAGYFVGNVYSSGIYSGDGSGLTALNGTNISSGTVADARLSSNIPLKNGANTFTAAQTLQADAIMQANVRYMPYLYVGTVGTPSAADKKTVHLNPSSAQSSNTISDGTNGDEITFINISASNSFTFQIASGNLILPGGADYVMGYGDSISFSYVNSISKWVCTAYSNN